MESSITALPGAQPGAGAPSAPAGAGQPPAGNVQQALLIMPNQDGSVTVSAIDPPPGAAEQGEQFSDMKQALDAVEQVFGVPDKDQGDEGAGEDASGDAEPDSSDPGEAGEDEGEGPQGQSDYPGGGPQTAGAGTPGIPASARQPKARTSNFEAGYADAKRGR